MDGTSDIKYEFWCQIWQILTSKTLMSNMRSNIILVIGLFLFEIPAHIPIRPVFLNNNGQINQINEVWWGLCTTCRVPFAGLCKITFKNGSIPSSFCLFTLFSHSNSNNKNLNNIPKLKTAYTYVVLVIRTWCCRIIGADDSTELWRPPSNYIFSSFFSWRQWISHLTQWSKAELSSFSMILKKNT